MFVVRILLETQEWQEADAAKNPPPHYNPIILYNEEGWTLMSRLCRTEQYEKWIDRKTNIRLGWQKEIATKETL